MKKTKKTTRKTGLGLQYTKEVMKHFMKPKHIKDMKNASASGKVGNPRCGDVMQLFIKVKNNKITDASFKTFGCVAAIATSDVLCDLVIGKTIQRAKKIKNTDIIKKLKKLPVIKVHCSVLGKDALNEAIKNYEKRQLKQKKAKK